MEKTAIARLYRVSWRTVGRACERVVASELDPKRLDGLLRIDVDEISWRKHRKYLTLVVDHDRGCVVWGGERNDAKTLDGFFDELGTERASQIEAVPMDLGPAFLKSVTAESHAPRALVCANAFHLVKAFKGSRWALWKNPADLNPAQANELAKIKRTRGGIWWAYKMREQFRANFASGPEPAASIVLLDRWITRVLRSKLKPFMKAAHAMRDRRMTHINVRRAQKI